MECPRCGKKIEKGWNFCPFCGYRPDNGPQMFGGAFGGVFNSLMKRLSKQMEEMNKQMDRDLEVMDLSPLFRDMEGRKINITKKPHARGFTIRINRSNDSPPKVDVKTFGKVDRDMQKQIQDNLKRMGISSPDRMTIQQPKPAARGQAKRPEKDVKSFPTPKYCEEPKADVKKEGSRVVVDLDLPGVGSDSDIEIKELENSIEVRAMAGDKAFFKILTKPAGVSLREKQFGSGKLHLEFS